MSARRASTSGECCLSRFLTGTLSRNRNRRTRESPVLRPSVIDPETVEQRGKLGHRRSSCRPNGGGTLRADRTASDMVQARASWVEGARRRLNGPDAVAVAGLFDRSSAETNDITTTTTGPTGTAARNALDSGGSQCQWQLSRTHLLARLFDDRGGLERPVKGQYSPRVGACELVHGAPSLQKGAGDIVSDQISGVAQRRAVVGGVGSVEVGRNQRVGDGAIGRSQKGVSDVAFCTQRGLHPLRVKNVGREVSLQFQAGMMPPVRGDMPSSADLTA